MLKQRGVSLIELMISITISMMIMVGITIFFAANSASSQDNVKSTRVNNVLRSSTELITREINRAGYWKDAYLNVGAGYSNPFSALLTSSFVQANDCVLFAYDENMNGILDATEYKGFRLNSGGIDSKVSGAAHNCTEGQWQRLTPSSVTISQLQFTRTSSSVAVGAKSAVDRQLRVQIAGNLTGNTQIQQLMDETVIVKNDIIQ